MAFTTWADVISEASSLLDELVGVDLDPGGVRRTGGPSVIGSGRYRGGDAQGLERVGQCAADAFDQANNQSVAHHEGTSAVRHTGLCPPVRETIEPLQLQRGEATKPTISRVDDMLEP